MANAAIVKELATNETFLKNEIGESFDIKYRHFSISTLDNAAALIVYVSGMVDSRVIDETILGPLMTLAQPPKEKGKAKNERISALLDYEIFTSMGTEAKLWVDLYDAVAEGDTVLLIDGCDTALILSTRKYEGRSVDEPVTESEIRAPRDGFVENIQSNAALIRRRIKDVGLRFDTMKIGERTKTDVSIAYIKSLANESLIKEVKSRLQRIKTDAILESGYLEEFIEDSPSSLFPQIANTERPDKACAALLEGRVVILVDCTPFALIIPTVFWQFFLSTGDYYERQVLGSFIRWIRYAALFFAISLSSLYVLLTSFHQEMLPTNLALKIAQGRSGVPFPAVIETFLLEIILEIMKEAGLRMPKPIGQTVSIVGTLVVGQAAVSAGLVSPMLVIVIAVAAISSFAVPSYSMNNSLRLIKFPLLVITAMFGLLGYLAGIMVIMLHLMSLRSFGTPYLAPVMPLNISGLKDVLSRAHWWKMDRRPGLARPKDAVRQAPNMEPKLPKNE